MYGKRFVSKLLQRLLQFERDLKDIKSHLPKKEVGLSNPNSWITLF